ncbi:unnamed protein product [Mytilus coruscus]|uniref:C1q domain-containing protein n=1 Tax=Mytilus coruscus TaxID=42192 RepID=A0A6J8AC70_MYTCO|nr:unnamed protein product [Mytilus coruscus]
MFLLKLVVVVFCFVSSGGFLLDGSTKSPQAQSVMSDSHFTTLLTFIFEERKSREKLENVVQRLKQQLTSFGNCNCKGAEVTDALKNNTDQLQNDLDLLRKDFSALQLQCAQFDKRLSTSEANTGRLKQDITGLKLVNSVTDLHSVFNLENKTNQLEIKVQNTENTIQTILSSANVRSQDIIGLLNKIKATDNMTLHLENEIKKSNGKLSIAVADINSRKQDFIALVSKTEDTNDKLKSLESKPMSKYYSIEKDVMNNVQHLQNGLNDTSLKLNRISNRAVLSARASGGTVASFAVIPFKHVHTAHGLNDLTSIRTEGKFTCEKSGLYLSSRLPSSITLSAKTIILFKQVHNSHGIIDLISIRNNGKFTCDKPGFYFISVYVATDANVVGYYTVYKNNEPIATAYRHPNSYIIIVATIVTERLRTNDTVYIQNGPEIYVRGIATGSLACRRKLKTSKLFAVGEDPFDTLRSVYSSKHPGHSESVDSEIFNVRGWYEFVRDHTILWERYYTEWLEAERPVFLLYYEDLKTNLPATLKKLAHFLEWRVHKKDIDCTLVMSEGHFHRRQVHNITNSEIFVGKLWHKLEDAELIV